MNFNPFGVCVSHTEQVMISCRSNKNKFGIVFCKEESDSKKCKKNLMFWLTFFKKCV